MKKKPISPANNAANIPNPNKGAHGTNRQYDQAQGNRGKLLNPNRKKKHRQKSTVAFLVSDYDFYNKLDTEHDKRLETPSWDEAISENLICDATRFPGYRVLVIKRGIKSVKELNKSGALDAIRSVLEGNQARHHWQFWVDGKACIDEGHPGYDFAGFEPCPAIDGYH